MAETHNFSSEMSTAEFKRVFDEIPTAGTDGPFTYKAVRWGLMIEVHDSALRLVSTDQELWWGVATTPVVESFIKMTFDNVREAMRCAYDDFAGDSDPGPGHRAGVA